MTPSCKWPIAERSVTVENNPIKDYTHVSRTIRTHLLKIWLLGSVLLHCKIILLCWTPGIVRYPLVSLSYSFCWFSFWSIVRTYRRACRRHIFLWWHTLDSNSLNQPLPSCLDYLNVLSANSWDMKSSRVYVIMICYPPRISPIERFHSRGQHLCRLMGTKESVLLS